MKLYCLSVIFLLTFVQIIAQPIQQQDSSWKKIRRSTPDRINNLVHTKLDVKFNYNNASLIGKAWVTLTPHIYPTDSLALDAKGMQINKLSLFQDGKPSIDLPYTNTGEQLKIKLNKSYKKGEKYTVYIDYLSLPNEYEKKSGRDPMLGTKGLYFINPKGENKRKPTQIWTQGETESNSVWFPTIDQTQQKTTQEIYMTVPDMYVTLSNGKLVTQKKNTDGTRTDYWKMDQPHSPYLFYMGVGDYAVIKDSWKGKEVNYYVEPEYASVARKIFGSTPEMMTYFSKLTGVDYPWIKYSQITGRDYVAGAMENTTATMHQNRAQQDARELTDGNIWEGTIAHELFHQWFGDYVTAESWSNLTVNESFADYSQLLWQEYKYGADAALAENHQGMQGYLFGNNEQKHLVRFYYADREDMFDGVSYQKGGRILHMLRKFIGDSAFFKGLNLYLQTNKFKSAEAHHLRLALEETSGKDLNWFFDQWYFGSGHPKLDIQNSYDSLKKQVVVRIKQTQASGKIFRLPTFIDIYHGSSKMRYPIVIENKSDSFYFPVSTKPDLINFDGDKILLCEKKENKNLDQYIHQYTYAANYMDRLEAIEFCSKKMSDPKAIELLKKSINDPYHEIRKKIVSILNFKSNQQRIDFEPTIKEAVAKEKNRPVKALMIGLLGQTEQDSYKSLYESNVNDSSYSVAGAALKSLYLIDSLQGLSLAKKLNEYPSKGDLETSINQILLASGDEEIFEKIAVSFQEMELSDSKFMMMQQMGQMIGSMKSNIRIQRAIRLIIDFRNSIPAMYREQTDPFINGMILQGAMNKLKLNGNAEMVKFLEEQLK